MREFYLLAHDSYRDDLQVVSDYDVGDFDLPEGKPFRGTIPEVVKLWVGDGKPSDCLANALSWTIVSDRFLALIRRFVTDSDMQVFPAPLYAESTRKPIVGYHLINVTRCVRALVGLGTNAQLILNHARIPADAHLFSVVGRESFLILSQEVFKDICAKKLQGMAFIKMRLV